MKKWTSKSFGLQRASFSKHWSDKRGGVKYILYPPLDNVCEGELCANSLVNWNFCRPLIKTDFSEKSLHKEQYNCCSLWSDFSLMSLSLMESYRYRRGKLEVTKPFFINILVWYTELNARKCLKWKIFITHILISIA